MLLGMVASFLAIDKINKEVKRQDAIAKYDKCSYASVQRSYQGFQYKQMTRRFFNYDNHKDGYLWYKGVTYNKLTNVFPGGTAFMDHPEREGIYKWSYYPALLEGFGMTHDQLLVWFMNRHVLLSAPAIGGLDNNSDGEGQTYVKYKDQYYALYWPSVEDCDALYDGKRKILIPLCHHAAEFIDVMFDEWCKDIYCSSKVLTDEYFEDCYLCDPGMPIPELVAKLPEGIFMKKFLDEENWCEWNMATKVRKMQYEKWKKERGPKKKAEAAMKRKRTRKRIMKEQLRKEEREWQEACGRSQQ